MGGTVHFVGQIINAACSVKTNSTNQTVMLGHYRNANVTSVGTYSGKEPFTINLEDCDTAVSTTAAIALTGSEDANDNTLLFISNIIGGSASWVFYDQYVPTGGCVTPGSANGDTTFTLSY